jgi:hypothetical protein
MATGDGDWLNGPPLIFLPKNESFLFDGIDHRIPGTEGVGNSKKKPKNF